MAERAGFEPAVEVTPHDRLAICCLQPLGHLSASKVGSLDRLDHLINPVARRQPAIPRHEPPVPEPFHQQPSKEEKRQNKDNGIVLTE